MPTRAPSLKNKARKELDSASNAIDTKKRPRPNKKQAAVAARFEGPWEPSAKELEIFERCCRYESLSSIAKDMGYAAPSSIMLIRDKVGQWKAAYHNDRTEAFRSRALQTYEHVISEALDAWNKIKESLLDKPDGTPGGSPGDGYLKTVISSLNEIRKLWYLDKIPEKQKPPGDADKRDDGSNGMRVAGKSRNEVLSELISKIQGKISNTSAN